MKPKEIREMSIKDLRERIETEKANLAQMKITEKCLSRTCASASRPRRPTWRR